MRHGDESLSAQSEGESAREALRWARVALSSLGGAFEAHPSPV